MAASLAAVTLCSPTLPLLPLLNLEKLCTVEIGNEWSLGGNDHCRKMHLPVRDFPSTVCIVDQFLNITHSDHAKFCNVLGGDLRFILHKISDSQASKTCQFVRG